jgi:hypothetical protein
MKYLLSPVLLLFCVADSFSQDIQGDTIYWSIVSNVDKAKDSTAQSYDSQLTTLGNHQINWTQKRVDISGEVTSIEYNLTVDSVLGNWSNVKENGEVTYHVSSQRASGTMKFFKSAIQYIISVELIGRNGGKMNTDLVVSKIDNK